MDPGPSKSTSGGKKSTKSKEKVGIHSQEALEKQARSITASTSLPETIRKTAPTSAVLGSKLPKAITNVKDKKLRTQLERQHHSQKRAAESARLADEYINVAAPGEDAGLIETETDLERTAKVTQQQIQDSVGIETATKGFELRLDGGKNGVGLGPYRCDYTGNGRHLLLGGRKGHLAAFDWQTGKLSCEIQVRETVRDVKWLHNSSFFAAAQKKYTYIYDDNGIEIHKLKNHMDVNRLEFLPYHFLLATVGSTGYLKYQDTSTGQLVSQHRTGLGSCNTMTQNPLTAVLHLGHSNGTVTLWTPNLSTPAVKLLAHRGPVTGISIDTRSGGREMATCGLDGTIKVWDSRMLGKGPRREWLSRKPASDICYSQRGLLGVAWGAHVSVYQTAAPLGNAPPGPYLSHGFPRSEPIQIQFCPFQDVLGVGHLAGFTSLLVPGAGEPNFDSREADPFESRNARREREVHSLLDKIQPDLISVDPNVVGSLYTKQTNIPAAEQEAALASSRRRNPEAVPRSVDGRPYANLSRIERLELDNSDAEPMEQDSDLVSHLDGTVQISSGIEKPVKEKHRMRGRNKAMKKYLRKKQKNVIDPNRLAVQEKLERRRKEQEADRKKKQNGGVNVNQKTFTALDVFTRSRH